MKFDYIVGNPPYQDEISGENKEFAPPVYHKFMDACYELGNVVELIHPGRFLFKAGGTPKEWNSKMLNDPHFKILFYEQDIKKVFPTKDIKGGVVISYRDKNKDFGAIQVFSPYEEMNSISHKASPINFNDSLSSIMYNQSKFNLDAMYAKHPELRNVIGSNGRDKRFRNNIFDKVNLFTDQKSGSDDIHIFGVINNKRIWKYFPLEFIDTSHENIYKWKVLVARVNGAGLLGEILSSPLVSSPGEGYTQTFIGIGSFNTEQEAQNVLKYIKTKFARALLGMLKVTQDNSIETWRMIPLQDFTSSSDIDWSQSIADIDRQLYARYDLNDSEIEFIESHVKEMT